MKKDLKLMTVNNQTGEYSFSFSTEWGPVSGRNKLVQDITKRILTQKGSNKFEPSWGENFYSLIGTASYDRNEEIKEILPVMVKNIQEAIIEEQALDGSLEDSEKLKSINISEVEIDSNLLGWKIVLEIITQDFTKNKITLI